MATQEVLKDDVDDAHDTETVNKAVESEVTLNEAITPKEGMSTSAFKVAVAQFVISLLSLIITFAVGAKWLGAEMADPLRATLTQAMGLVTILFGSGASLSGAFYIHGRNKVAQIKASAAADVVRAKAAAFHLGGVAGEIRTLEPQVGIMGGPLGGFGLDPISMAVMGINMAMMFLGNATTGKKAKVVKALRAAAAALAEYKSSGE